jgi:hypothetical protein
MARKKGLKTYSEEELVQELARRHADREFRDGMTMTDIELAAERLKSQTGPPSVRLMLSRMKAEKPTAKACPRCGKRTPVKARDRERTVRSLSGTVTFKRNYHYCESCKYGFYPVDRLLDLPEEGELTGEMERRVLDFGINDVYGEGAARWNLHYAEPISDNLLRRVVSRVGQLCQDADHGVLQEELKAPSAEPANILVVESDGSMLPIRGEEPWKEAKVGVVYRQDPVTHEPAPGSARYVAVVGGTGEYAPVLGRALQVEQLDEAPTVLWLGDGAPSNWNLADQLAPDAVQILDWYHAVEHAMVVGRLLLDEESPLLPLWKRRAEQLLASGDVNAMVDELMCCTAELEARRRGVREGLQAIDQLIGYYRTNEKRMQYRRFRDLHYPIGSGAAESAHKHVLQARMKRAGQRWGMKGARRMARLRAAYRTAGPAGVYQAIRTAARRRPPTGRPTINYRYARYGPRDRDRSAQQASI